MNIDPEVTLTTSLFMWPAGLLEVAPMLRAEDFQSEDSRRIYRAMLGIVERGEAIDTISVVDELHRSGIEAEAACNLVDRATDGVPIEGQAKRYARLLVEAARNREIASVIASASDHAQQGGNATEIMQQLMAATWDSETRRSDNEIKRLAEHIIPVLDHCTGQRNGNTQTDAIPTGIAGLDLIVQGIFPSELWIIGAMPGRGKTALATQIAMNSCCEGLPVLFFSMEMTAGQLLRRILGMNFGAGVVRNPRALSAERWNELTEYAGQLAGIPLYVEDSSSLSASDLSLKARLCIRQHGIRLIIVDYLQLIRGTGKELRERVSNAANMLRQLAKDTGVPVISLSQLRRPGNINDVPSMIDLKESGDIEAHAHAVVLIYMPQGEDRQPNGLDELIVGKQRNGPVSSVPVVFDRKNLIFHERQL